MLSSYVSTSALRASPRLDTIRLQRELTDRSVELSTARHADVGVTLGLRTGRAVGARLDLQEVEGLLVSNGTARARLAATQVFLTDLKENASGMLASLVALPPGQTAARALTIEAGAALERFADRANASEGGSYLFAGTNTGVAPISRFADGPQAAIEAAFLARFGVAVGSPGAESIAPADMTSFLQNEFAAVFADPGWTTEWSSASFDDIVSRIAPNERITTSVNANADAFRQIAMGLSMIAGLGISALSESTRVALVSEARLIMGSAVSETVALQAATGFSEQAVARADERLSLSRDLFATVVNEEEGADPAEAKIRIDLLTTQIEMNYALTAQLSRLSILNYA